ncbi:MAG: hypothetical protein D3910_00505 [Candidatus Electrothrix sp. ATG2]|nr:hypothetical protein [Candidatus Electrothrix sp. ATG2]
MMDGNSLMFRLLVGEEKTHCAKKWTFFRSGDLFFATDSMIGGVKMNAGRRGKSLARFFYVWISAIILVVFSVNFVGAETEIGSISGTIITTDGTTGIAGVYAQAFQLVEENLVWKGDAPVTTESGIYKIEGFEGEGLADGEYFVRFWAQDTDFVTRWYSDSNVNGVDYNDATSVTVSGGNDTPGIDIQLSLGGSISGKVVKDAGCESGTVENLEIKVYDALGILRGITRTLANGEFGEFTVTGLPTGQMKILIWDRNGSQVEEWYQDKPDFASANSVTVGTSGLAVNFCSLRVNMAPVYLILGLF